MLVQRKVLVISSLLSPVCVPDNKVHGYQSTHTLTSDSIGTVMIVSIFRENQT